VSSPVRDFLSSKKTDIQEVRVKNNRDKSIIALSLTLSRVARIGDFTAFRVVSFTGVVFSEDQVDPVEDLLQHVYRMTKPLHRNVGFNGWLEACVQDDVVEIQEAWVESQFNYHQLRLFLSPNDLNAFYKLRLSSC
jgi:hypothetical protein